MSKETLFPVKTLEKTCYTSSGSYCSSLKKRGYDELGSGCFATVFHKPKSKFVVKVSNEEAKGDAYFNYLSLINKSNYKNNPFFPKIKDVKVYPNFFVTRIEKLEHIRESLKNDEGKGKKNIDFWVNEIGVAVGTDKRHGLPQFFSSVIRSKKITKRVCGILRKVIDSPTPKMLEDVESINQVKEVLAKAFETHTSDIHQNNIMVRTDKFGMKSLVITDPVAWRK